MNWKFIIYSIVLVLLSGFVGYFFGPKVDGSEKLFREALKKVDSTNIVNFERQKAYEDILKRTGPIIKQRQTNLKKRDEDFKNDTIPISDDELIQRARAIIRNN